MHGNKHEGTQIGFETSFIYQLWATSPGDMVDGLALFVVVREVYRPEHYGRKCRINGNQYVRTKANRQRN